VGDGELACDREPETGTGAGSPAPVFPMDFTLTSEQELVRETARAFCDREVTPHAREWDRDEEMDRGIVGRDLTELAERDAPGETGSFLAIWSHMLHPANMGRYADERVRPRWEPEARGPTTSPAPPLANPRTACRRGGGGATRGGHHRAVLGAAVGL
jgi:hypothetical protein